MSVARLLTELETLVGHHERQEAHHAAQEDYHREQRAVHAAGLQAARERLAAYRAAAEAAGELVARFQPPVPSMEDDLRPGEPVLVSRLAARVAATKEPAETFTGASIAREVNQRYGKRLRRPAQARTVATALRRMAAAGRIFQVEEGRAYHEAMYSRGSQTE
jgi:DNA-binding TFAR19-related protein (PDSD5 family)